jgi:hypothetical protein
MAVLQLVRVRARPSDTRRLSVAPAYGPRSVRSGLRDIVEPPPQSNGAAPRPGAHPRKDAGPAGHTPSFGCAAPRASRMQCAS